MTNADLEKEVELASDLKEKLDVIAGEKPKTKRKSKTTVSQEVASPRDAAVTADIGSMDKMKQMIEKNESAVPAPAPVVESTVSYPDATKHKYISFAKSALRIVAGIVLFTGDFVTAGVLIVLAEILGIAEELV